MGYALIRYIVKNSGDEKGENAAWQTAEVIQSHGNFQKISNFRTKSRHLATPLSLQLPLRKKKTFYAFHSGNLQWKCGFAVGKLKNSLGTDGITYFSK